MQTESPYIDRNCITEKNEACLPNTGPGLLLYPPCRFLFTACYDVLLACPTELLPGSVSYVCDRPVWSVSVDNLSGGGVLVLNHDGTANVTDKKVSRWAEPKSWWVS